MKFNIPRMFPRKVKSRSDIVPKLSKRHIKHEPAHTLLPFEKIGEWDHDKAGHKVPIGYVHVRVHPMVE